MNSHVPGWALACVGFAALWATGTSAAEGPTSMYTPFSTAECEQTVDDTRFGIAEWECPGFRETGVWTAQVDQRTLVSFGPDAREQCAARQTMIASNRVGDAIEWRLSDDAPFAAIMRWTTEGEGREAEYLVVTKLGGEVCHAAYVDAGLPEHEDLARMIADTQAGPFDCARDTPILVTTSGRSVDQIAAGFPCSEP